MMNEKDELRNILFGYSNIPACGAFGEDDGGFSVTVYKNGKLIHKTYIFDQIVKAEVEYKISGESISAIKALMKRNQKMIDSFDDSLHNGSCDGCGNFFVFNGKQVITWNISYTNSLFLFSCKEYYSAAKQENRILSLFFAAAEILKHDGISLKLNEVNFNNGSNY